MTLCEPVHVCIRKLINNEKHLIAGVFRININLFEASMLSVSPTVDHGERALDLVSYVLSYGYRG
jgi:hypothetical protein